MKILFVARSTVGHTISGGMEVVQDALASEFVRRGHAVAIVTTQGADRTVGADYDKYWEVFSRSPGRYSHEWWRGTADEHAPWVSWSPDVVFSVSRAGASMRMMKTKMLSQCHGTALAEIESSLRTRSLYELAKVPLNVLRIYAERRFYGSVRKVVAVSDEIRRQLVSPPFSVEDVLFLPNGVDESEWSFDQAARLLLRRELGISETSSVALTASRLHRQKGLDLAIESLSMAGLGGAHLLVAGDGPELAALRKLTARLGVERRVHFLGRLQRVDLRSAMSASDVLLFPTRRAEGAPMVLLEAAANGLTIVADRKSRISEVLSPDVGITTGGRPADISAAWLAAPARAHGSRLPARLAFEGVCNSYEALFGAIADR